MSEFQYYEFRAIDRPLSPRETGMLRKVSSRGEITSSSYINTYAWGDFKGDPDALMETCFDAFVHVTNWGTRRFSLRLPGKLLRPKVLSACCKREGLQSRKAGEFIVIDFCTEIDPEWCDDGADNWMASLIGLRTELMSGDDRSLYLGWLCDVQHSELDDDDLEPPVPRGLQSLSASLKSLVDFLDIDTDLLELAASESLPLLASPGRGEVAAWVRGLPPEERDALLVDAVLGADLRGRFELSRAEPQAKAKRRTAGQLLAESEERSKERLREEAAQQKAEEEHEAREAAADRDRYLDQLAQRGEAAWKDVTALVLTKQQGNYDTALKLLIDLRDLAERQGGQQQFQAMVNDLRIVHSAKSSFVRRLNEAGL